MRAQSAPGVGPRRSPWDPCPSPPREHPPICTWPPTPLSQVVNVGPGRGQWSRAPMLFSTVESSQSQVPRATPEVVSARTSLVQSQSLEPGVLGFLETPTVPSQDPLPRSSPTGSQCSLLLPRFSLHALPSALSHGTLSNAICQSRLTPPPRLPMSQVHCVHCFLPLFYQKRHCRVTRSPPFQLQ